MQASGSSLILLVDAPGFFVLVKDVCLIKSRSKRRCSFLKAEERKYFVAKVATYVPPV
jgi:hypothetical protein